MTTTLMNAAASATKPPASPVVLNPAKIHRAIGKRSFAALATTSSIGQPHVAGVLYELVGGDLWLNTMANSRKAQNMAGNDRVGVTIVVRRIPFGPPSTIQFQARATVFEPSSTEVSDLVAAGSLKAITGHGELELPGSCFVRITPNRRLHTYGLGLSLIKLIRDPLNASGSIDRDQLPWSA
jgi:hypothetical protein